MEITKAMTSYLLYCTKSDERLTLILECLQHDCNIYVE